MRACDLTRARAEEAVLPGGGEAIVDAEKIVPVLTEVVRHAVERTVGFEGSGGDLATAVVGARLRERGLLSQTAVRDRVHEQILYGPGAEGDARRLALSLDARPRSTPVAGRGLLAWVRYNPGLPLTAIIRRFGLVDPREASGEHDAPVALGDLLSITAARVEYAKVRQELADGREHEALAAYRKVVSAASKVVSAASIHKDPLAPLLVQLVRLMQIREPSDCQRGDDAGALPALEPPRPEATLLSAAAELTAALSKLRELPEDSGRLFYLRDGERRAWALAESARSTLSDPERTLLAAAFERLGSRLRAEVGETYGKAVVMLSLVTERLSFVTQTRVEVRLVNASQATARDLRLRVTSADRLRLLGSAEVTLDKLGPGVEAVLGFDVKPLTAGRRAMTFKLSYADASAQRVEKSLAVEPELIPTRGGFQRIELNPFVAGPPIRSAEMFFGRKDVLDFVVSNLKGQHQDSLLLLHGARRTGKSSVFYRLGRGDLLPEYVPVYLDLQGLGDLTTESLLAGIARRIVRALGKHGLVLSVTEPRAGDFAAEPFATLTEFPEDLEEEIAGRQRVLVLMDEFEILETKASEGRLTTDIFPYWRSVAQHSASLSFILAGTRRLDEMDPSYWAVLYGLVRDRAIGFLAESEMRELVTQPLAGRVEVDDLALEAIFRLTSGHPYYTQLVCQTLVSELNRRAERNFVLLSDVLEAGRLVLSLGGGQITHEWGSVGSRPGRLALAALAELAPDAAVWVERDELAARLDRQRAGISDADLGAALGELARRELITTPSAEGPIRYRMDLLRQWVRQERPIPAVLAEPTS